MVKSLIQWTDRSDWNPIRGCTRVSPGCGGPGPHGGCYAEAIAARFSGPGKPFDGFASMTANGPHWTGKVEVMWDRLTDPLKWRAPAMIFALSMSDLFHEKLPDTEIASIYAVMVAAVHVRGHTFQVLTKRSERMCETLNSETFWDQVNVEADMHVLERTDPLVRRTDDARATLDEYGPRNPPPKIWLGVSVEDRDRLPRIDDLRATPAAVRFLSLEPLLEFLGPINLNRIDQAIVGGESGPRARVFDLAWARDIRDQCSDRDIACFIKQLGARPWSPSDRITHRNCTLPSPRGFSRYLNDSHGGDPAEWPADLRVRQMPHPDRPRPPVV